MRKIKRIIDIENVINGLSIQTLADFCKVSRTTIYRLLKSRSKYEIFLLYCDIEFPTKTLSHREQYKRLERILNEMGANR